MGDSSDDGNFLFIERGLTEVRSYKHSIKIMILLAI